MPPYEIRVKAVYDGKNLILREPVPVSEGTEVEVTLDVDASAERPSDAEEWAQRIRDLSQTFVLPKGTDPEQIDASRHHDEMYPDRW